MFKKTYSAVLRHPGNKFVHFMPTNRRQVAHHEESCESGVKQEGDPFGGCSWNTQAANARRVGCNTSKIIPLMHVGTAVTTQLISNYFLNSRY